MTDSPRLTGSPQITKRNLRRISHPNSQTSSDVASSARASKRRKKKKKRKKSKRRKKKKKKSKRRRRRREERRQRTDCPTTRQGGWTRWGVGSLFAKEEEFSGVPRVPKWRSSWGSSLTRPFHRLRISLCFRLRSARFSLLLSLLPNTAKRLRVPRRVLPTLGCGGISCGEVSEISTKEPGRGCAGHRLPQRPLSRLKGGSPAVSRPASRRLPETYLK